MQVSCPSCSTNFAVPDRALQPKGRTLKCAKCGHKWFQSIEMPEPEPLEDFGLDEDSFPPPPVSDRISPSRDYRPSYDEDDLDIPDPPLPDFARDDRDGDAKPGDLDLSDSDPAPIPAIFATEEKRERSAIGLWLLFGLLLIGAGLGGLYYFQDRAVHLVPGLHAALTNLGLRKELPGAGLQLRHAGTPERYTQNETESLIMRGIIANVSDRERPVPPLKLMLHDAQKNVVQEKISPPPVTTLPPGGTAGFRIILERPNPTAEEVNVQFTAPTDLK